MRHVLSLLPVLALLLTACGPAEEKSAPASTNSAAVGHNPLNAPAEYLGAAAKAKRSATRVVDLASVSRAVQMFQASEGRNPSELKELVTEGYLPQLPALPAGQKYVYDSQTGQVQVGAG